MKTKTTKLGFTADFEAYVVARAAQNITKRGMTDADAIKEALYWTEELFAELASGRTERAKAFQKEVITRTYNEIRKAS